MSAFLGAGPFKMNLLEAKARDSFLSLVEELDGNKAMVCDHSLVGPVNLLTTMSGLRERGVEKMLPLKTKVYLSLDVRHFIFVVRPTISNMDLIADYAQGLKQSDASKVKTDMRILFIPRVTKMCELRLEERGVLGSFDLKSVNCFLFPLDSDLMSMEYNDGFRDSVCYKDPSILMDCAVALRELESQFGTIPHFAGVGAAAKTVMDYFLMLDKQDPKKKICGVSSIDHVILFDRRVDLLTPLATQLTYEGLIDEFFSINSGTVSFPGEKFSRDDENEMLAPAAKKVVDLNSGDELYNELRDKSFNGIGPALRRKAQAVSKMLEQRNSRSIDSMRAFVSQLPQLQASKKSLATHTTIAELIKGKTDEGAFLDSLAAEQEILCALETDRSLQFIEDRIANKAPFISVMRLLCLQSQVNGGIRQRTLENYITSIIATYGLKMLLPLNNLQKAELVRPMSGARHYSALKRTLRLIIEDDSEIEPTDICFTHSIYAPLSVRLMQHFRTWTSMKDILDMVPGPCFEHRSAPSSGEGRKVVMVFFLGGCTSAEVSALRFLSQREDSNVDYVVATTKLINGNSLLRSVMELDALGDPEIKNNTI